MQRTAGSVAEKLKAFGCDEVVAGIGRTGVVGVIRGRKGTAAKVIGMRADMDALPIEEATGLPYKSTVPGKMHACGHDGHTAMLLGAARYLAETRNFAGTAVVIFQPAEEGGAGGKAMVEDGMMDRFGIGEVYGMHNFPGMPVGEFAHPAGPDHGGGRLHRRSTSRARARTPRARISASTRCWSARRSSTNLQSIVSRNVDPLESAVVSICMFQAGNTDNVIPQTAQLARHRAQPDARGARPAGDSACTRSSRAPRKLYGAKAKLKYRRGYPVLENHAAQTDFAAAVAGDDRRPATRSISTWRR